MNFITAAALNSPWIMRLFVALSAFYGFVYVARMHDYMPLWKCLAKGLGMTLEGHLGLWLATFQIKGRLRFLVALLVMVPLLGLCVLWHEIHPAVAVGALVYTSWILFQTIRGKWFGTQSI